MITLPLDTVGAYALTALAVVLLVGAPIAFTAALIDAIMCVAAVFAGIVVLYAASEIV